MFKYVLTDICIIVPISAYRTEVPIMYNNLHIYIMYKCFYGDNFIVYGIIFM